MKWYQSDKYRKAWSIIRLTAKLLVLAAMMVFLGFVLNDPYDSQNNLYLYLSLGALSVFLLAVIFFTHRRSDD